MTRALPLLSICAVALGVGGSALADPALERPSTVVDLADLRLDNDPGARIALRRISHAAQTVCGPMDIRNIRSRMAVKACREEAVGQAVGRLNATRVTALYRQRPAPAAATTLAALEPPAR